MYVDFSLNCPLGIQICILLACSCDLSFYSTHSFGLYELQNLRPDVVTYTTLMKALIRVDKFDKVHHGMTS